MRIGGLSTTAAFLVSLGAASAQTPQSGEPVQTQQTSQEENSPLRRFLLSSEIAVDLPPAWSEQQQMPLPPSARLAPFSPPVTFLEFRSLEDPETYAVLRVATTTNPFLGRNEVALDTQMHGRGGSGTSFVDYLFYFFFPPPGDCLNGSSETFEKAQKEAGGKDDAVPDVNIRTDCEHAPTLSDFYSLELSPGVVFQSTNGVKQASGTFPEFYVPPMEKLEANGMTFYIFEAQGQTRLEWRTVNHFNLPDDLRGAQADFFWAVGAPSPFPFLKDARRKNVLLVQIAYATTGLAPDQRGNFLKLLQQIHAP